MSGRTRAGPSPTQPNQKNWNPTLKKPEHYLIRIRSDPTWIGSTSGQAQPDPTEIVNLPISHHHFNQFNNFSTISNPIQFHFPQPFYSYTIQFNNPT